MANVGDLVVNLSARTQKFSKGMQKAQDEVKSLSMQVSKMGLLVGGGIAGAGAAIGGGVVKMVGAAMSKVKSLFSDGFGRAAAAEQTHVAFEVLIGDAQSAKMVMEDLTNFAASTPFELPGLTDAARKLLAFGSGADTVTDELRVIGDIASGIGQPVGEIAEIYGKARVQGRLFGEDINQLTGRGIPIIGELAKQFGVSQDKVKGLVTEGKVGFPHIQRAFQSMTGEGGKFAGMMEKQSGTMKGLLSTLRDNIGLTFQKLAEMMNEAFDTKAAIQRVIAFVGRVRENVGKLKPVFTAFGRFVSTIWKLATQAAHSFFSMLGTWFPWLQGVAGITFDDVAKFLVTAFATGEWALNNLGDAANLAFAQVRLWAMQAGRWIKDAFGNAWGFMHHEFMKMWLPIERKVLEMRRGFNLMTGRDKTHNRGPGGIDERLGKNILAANKLKNNPFVPSKSAIGLAEMRLRGLVRDMKKLMGAEWGEAIEKALSEFDKSKLAELLGPRGLPKAPQAGGSDVKAKLPPALLQGTAEAFSAIVQAQTRAAGDNPLNVAKKALSQHQLLNKLVQQIAGNLNNMVNTIQKNLNSQFVNPFN